MALGQNIKRLREAQKLTQDQLALKAGGAVTQGIVAALEKRDSETSKHAARIATALGVSLGALLTGETGPLEKQPTPELNPRQQALLGLFDGLTRRQQEDLIRELQEKKQQNEELLTELLERRA